MCRSPDDARSQPAQLQCMHGPAAVPDTAAVADAPPDAATAAAPDAATAAAPKQPRCPLVERAEVVSVVAWGSMGLVLLGLVSTLWIGLAAPGHGPSEPPQFVTDINAAPAAELALLPGIGPELAGRIVAERELSGPFASAEQLERVRGIGPKTIDQVIPLVICGDPAAAVVSESGD